VFSASGVTDKGRVRPINEDAFAVREDLALCVIADGMGGHNAGEVAARMAVDAVVDAVRSAESPALHDAGAGVSGERFPFGLDPALSHNGNLLRTAILLANVQILEAASTAESFAGMGTTIVAARVVDGQLTVAHVGDSRLYLVTGARLRPLTVDDSWMASMVAREREVDPLLLQHHPMRNALTNVVGAHARTDVHVVDIALAGGEWLLLTTDGVHGVLDDDRLERLMVEFGEPRAIADAVIAAALARGSRDNCTAVVARCAL